MTISLGVLVGIITLLLVVFLATLFGYMMYKAVDRHWWKR